MKTKICRGKHKSYGKCLNPRAVNNTLDVSEFHKSQNYCRYCDNQYRKNRVRNSLRERFVSMAKTARKRTDGFISWKTLDLLFFIQDCKCAFLGEKLELSHMWLEHIMPVSKGGSNHLDNLIINHDIINRSKSDRYNYKELCRFFNRNYMEFYKKLAEIHRKVKQAILLLFCCSFFGIEYQPFS